MKSSKGVTDTTSQLQGVAMQAGTEFANGFANAVVGADNLGDALKALIKQTAKMILKLTIEFAIRSAMQALLFAKDGAAFDQGGLTKFASGGVVTSPTPFRFGGNRLGIMGEAGPEAVMPLTRIGGQLGVRAVGGGGRTTVVHQTNNITLTGGTQSEIAQLRTEIAVASAQAAKAGADGGYMKVGNDLMRDGPLSHRLRR